MSEITILHLSDIHFKRKKDDKNRAFRKEVQEKLIEAVAGHSQKYDTPDFVAVTGDIAFSGKKNEYDEALDFFNNLKTILPPETEFLVVPGNHDVDRKKVDEFAEPYHVVKTGKVEQFLQDIIQIKKKINAKFKTFRKFSHQINSSLYETKEDYFWVKKFPGKNVSFLGLNSCWASEGDKDQLNIALGYQQVTNALERSKGTGSRVVLLHHPLFNWLEERDIARCKGVIFNQCGLILHGHVHFDSADTISTPSDSCITLGANATYTHDGYIGFQFLRVEFREDSTAVRVWPYRWDTREIPGFVPDNHRWKGQKGKVYFDLETRRPCGDVDESDLRPLPIPGQYRDWVIEFHSRMDIQHLDPNARAYHVPLPEVYIPIETANPFYKPEGERLKKDRGAPIMDDEGHGETGGEEEGKEPAAIDIEELLGRQECILLRGSAGMGKTTLIKHLAYTIIQGQGPGSLCGYLPVVVFLKDLWPIYETKDSDTHLSFRELLNYYLKNKVKTLKWEEVEGFIKQNRALFLLDGLDEVPDHLRPGLVELIAAFWIENKKNRFLLTGRPHGIDDQVTRYFGRFLRDIELLDDKKIKEFIRKWFLVVSGQTTGLAEETAVEMIGDIEVNEYVSVFTQNPLLLTAVCVLYLDNKRLPDQRAELYCRIVDNLLYRRFHRRNDPGRVSRIEDYLKSLAFKMMTENRRAMDIGAARELLMPLFAPGDNKKPSHYKREINDLFNEIEPQCGLLKRVGGQGEGEIEFFHLSFQEFLAARYILYLDMDYRRFLDKEWWEETLLLYTGLINRDWKDKANRIVKEILTGSHDDEKTLHRCWLLGGKALRDIQEYKREEKVTVLAREKLMALIDTDIDLKDRFEAGEILGVLGDPRIQPPPMVRVEAGEFTMGSDELEREQPIHRVYLDEFMIGKYPVTNEEFRAFMLNDGYKKKEFWTPKSWEWLKEKNITEPRLWHDRKWNGPNFPVVGVSWYEAAAYARWLSQTTGYEYTLPSEAQWEKSARGGKGLVYPWGNKFDKNLCNSSESGLMRTSPVGTFPAGASPYGCMDMAGNVWEWCADWYEKDYYKKSPAKNPQGPSGGSGRVIRGGSWDDGDWGCQCACRHALHPAIRGRDLGFRLVRAL
jgi:formylglycine-generating enzyme required for sulfatase activity/calcineurin-like phosphoesterase family protein/energy-coupling factor transporter ATP-binding protein EcfA2